MKTFEKAGVKSPMDLGEDLPVSRSRSDLPLEAGVEQRRHGRVSAASDAAHPWSLLEDAPVGIHWVAADGNILWANRTELEMLGYASDEYIGRHIAEFHLDQDVITDILQKLERGETIKNYEARLRHKNGSARCVAIDSNVLWNDGKFLHTRCFTRDITDTKRLEEKARKQFAELESIYRTTPVGLALIDKDFRFARINKRLAEINGVPAELHVGRTLHDIVPDLAKQGEDLFRHVFRSGQPVLNVEVEGETPAQPGIRRTWNESWYPLKNESGATEAINVVVEEITDRKRADAALAESARIKDALYQLASRLHGATSLERMFDAALDAITGALRCERASILLFDERDVMRFVAWRGLSEKYRKAVEGHSPWKADEPSPAPIYLNDIDAAAIDDSLKSTVKAEGIGALAFIPLVAAGKLLGKFMMYFDAARQFSDEELDVSLTIARQLAFGIDHYHAAEALRESERHFRQMIDALPVAIYTTDAAGRLTHFNPAAVRFSGRVPELGTDQWCVSWKLYQPDGTPLPHDQCPMATSLKEGRPVRKAEAIAERPDGTRLWFQPYPTPLLDASGRIVGGINMLIDITERKQAEQSLAHLAAIVASSSDAILSKTLNSIVTSWNASAERMFGYTAEEMIGQSILKLIPPERQQEEEHILARLKAGEAIEHYETVRMTKEGRRIDVALTISPVKDRAGKTIGASKIVRDITERKRAEAMLRDHARQLALITDTAPVYIAHLDVECRFRFVNNAYAARFGMRPQDCVGRPLVAVLGKSAYESLRPHIEVVLRGEPVEFDVTIPYAAVGERFMHCSYAPEFDATGKVIGFVAAVADITERQRVEEALRTSEEKLKEADRRKDEFLAMLAHELRNPLAPITSAVQLLRQAPPENAVQQQARAIIERQTARLARLVDDLLEVSRITTGRIRLHIDRIPLSGIVERAIEAVRPLIDRHQHALSVSLPAGPIWLNADATRLEQVIVNLLNNAAKYTDQGGRIELLARCEDGEAVLHVKDTGIGIDAALLPRIFDSFTQAESSLDRSHGGLGIGLSVVQRLVSMHGGTVTAKSVVGEGSEFVVRLPLAPPPGSKVQVPMRSGSEPLRPLRILVVDDNVDAAQSMAMLLEVSGHLVRTAHDGVAAVKAVGEYRPHVVFLDIGLPELDGYEVAQRIRRNFPYGSIVLVALTGYGQAVDRERTCATGFDHHLVKPVDYDRVEQVLSDAARTGATVRSDHG
jgi:PAS domain S-box-containing protein